MGYNNSISNFKNKVKSVAIEVTHFETSIASGTWTELSAFPAKNGDGAQYFDIINTSQLQAKEDMTITMHYQGTFSTTFTGGYTLRARLKFENGSAKRDYLSEYGAGSLINRETLNVSFKILKGEILGFEVYHNKGSNHNFGSTIYMTGLFRTDDIAGDITELDAAKLINDSQPTDKILVTDGNDGFTYEDLPVGAPSTPTIYFAEVNPQYTKPTANDRIPFNLVHVTYGGIVQNTDPDYINFPTTGIYRVKVQLVSGKNETGTPATNERRSLAVRHEAQFGQLIANHEGGVLENRTTTDSYSIITNTLEVILDVTALDRVSITHFETGDSISQILIDSYVTIEKL